MPPDDAQRLSVSFESMRARATYLRWLHTQFRDFTLAGLLEDDQPIALRDIYVPLRLHTEQVSEEQAREEELADLGRPVSAWLEQRRHVAVVGLPGAGKSTLVRALVGELTGDTADELSRKRPDLVPVPLILRNHLEHIGPEGSLDALLDAWWSTVAFRIHGESPARKGMRPSMPICFR